jgi:hypothetical protein
MKKTFRDLPQISSRNLISGSRSFNRDISNNLLKQNSTKDTLAYKSMGKIEISAPKKHSRNAYLGGFLDNPSLKMPKKIAAENSKSMVPMPTNREIKILTVSKSLENKKKKISKSGPKKAKPLVPPLNL